MKEARRLFEQAGMPLYRTIMVFAILRDVLVVPLISKLWSLALMTTPEGFISNANLGSTILRSPWVLLIGAVLLGIFLLFTMWQVSATVMGVAYTYQGKRPKVADLLRVSALEFRHCTKPGIPLLLLYIAIILPLTNLFQASDMIGSFVVPEYIMDFINARLYLHVIYFAILLTAGYFALRWFYLLPAYFLKSHEFRTASAESFGYTKKGMLKNGIRLAVYSVLETVRIAVFPLLIAVAVCVLSYLAVAGKPYAPYIFAFIVLNPLKIILRLICGSMVYLSAMCFVVRSYYVRCEAEGSTADICLPELTREAKRSGSTKSARIRLSLLAVLYFAGMFVFITVISGDDPAVLENIIRSPYVIAHKGYSSRAPENTMDAFTLADETENASFIELDVWSSKDGIPMVLHNETITQATGLPGHVYDYTCEELLAIPAPYAMQPEEFPDARIPRLEDVIAAYSETTPLLIEIKGYGADEQLPAKIVALMEKYECTETSMIHSGSYAALKAVKECNPDIQCGLIQAIVTGNCYDLPYADFLSVEHSFVTNQMVEQLHRRGKMLFVWTVNHEDAVDDLQAADVDGFITDYPDSIAAEIRATFDPFDTLSSLNPLDDYDDCDIYQAIEQFEAGEY